MQFDGAGIETQLYIYICSYLEIVNCIIKLYHMRVRRKSQMILTATVFTISLKTSLALKG